MRIILFIIPVLFLTACGTPDVDKENAIVSKPYPAPELCSADKESYLEALNKIRSEGRNCSSEGYFSSAPALKWSDALYRASYEHSQDMAKNDHFTHMGSSTHDDWTAKVQQINRASSFKERIENNGYTKWKNIAENIEMGSSTLEGALTHWLRSGHHCANIMNPQFTDVGMARVKKEGSASIYYWTQNFAAAQ